MASLDETRDLTLLTQTGCAISPRGGRAMAFSRKLDKKKKVDPTR